MTVMKQQVDSITGFSKSTFLNSLAAGSARPLGLVDMSANDYPNAKIHLSVNVSTAMVVAGAIEVFFISSLNNTIWTDQINPSSSASASTKLNTAQLITTIKADQSKNIASKVAAHRLNWVCNDFARLVGDLPPYWTLVVKNLSGSALAASGTTAAYQKVSYQGTT